MNKSSKNQLQAKINHFLGNKRDTETISDVIESFKKAIECKSQITQFLLGLEIVFVDLLKSRDMTITIVPLKPLVSSSELMYKEWMQNRYKEVFGLIVECFESERHSEAQQALNTSMRLLAIEGQFPLEEHEISHNNNNNFPILHFNQIISKLLLSPRLMKNMIVKLSEFTSYDDFCYFTWKLILKNLIPTTRNELNSVFIQNYLELLNVLIPTISKEDENEEEEQDERKFLCKRVKFEKQLLRRNVNKVWNFVIQWPHTEVTQRQLLVLLLEKVMPYLEKPTLLTDYLMDSLDMGGPIALLSLQGIFILIHKYNMSYPNLYQKLYAMFEPEIFHMKFKPRLFHLAEIFLSSSYLPEMLVAAFAKRLARLALIAPPQDIIIIIYFIGNLIIRHPGLKRLICDETNNGREISVDPFMMDASDPNESRALESSLWEIQFLRSHMLPNVSQAAKNIITQPLPTQEYNIGLYLELKENDLFDQELSIKSKEYALTFERPLTEAAKAHQSAMNKYWKF